MSTKCPHLWYIAALHALTTPNAEGVEDPSSMEVLVCCARCGFQMPAQSMLQVRDAIREGHISEESLAQWASACMLFQ